MAHIPPILVAVDFSPCSTAAFRRAVRIAAWKNATLLAVHVVPLAPVLTADPLGPMGIALPLPEQAEMVADASRRLGEFVRTHGGNSRTRQVVEIGGPRDQILDLVRREQPGLLLVGAHSQFDASRQIGTTAAACAQWAQCPALVVREEQTGPFRGVMACIDFTETSRRALEEAIAIAAEDCARLHIVHIYADPWLGAGPPEDIRRNMPDFAQRYRKAIEDRLRGFCEPVVHEIAALKPEFHALLSPSHGEGIIAAAMRHGCDLVVLGTRGRWTARDFFWGSTAERVVREAPCSVLAVKPPRPAEADKAAARASDVVAVG